MHNAPSSALRKDSPYELSHVPNREAAGAGRGVDGRERTCLGVRRGGLIALGRHRHLPREAGGDRLRDGLHQTDWAVLPGLGACTTCAHLIARARSGRGGPDVW